MRGQELDIDVDLVGRLLRAQCPHWAHLPLRPVEPGGWDNRTFRLGDELSVRLPSADRYAPQVSGESREAFRDTLGANPATWARGRGWALWKALVTLAGSLGEHAAAAAHARHVIDQVLADHAGETRS